MASIYSLIQRCIMKIEDKVTWLEHEVQELKSRMAVLESLVGGEVYTYGVATSLPPEIPEDKYTPDDFLPLDMPSEPSRIDKDSYHLMRKAKEEKKKPI